MFDIGFWELLVIAIIGLLVIGPEKLPEVIRELFAIIRKVRLMFSDARASLEREIDLDEIRKLSDEVNMKKHIDDLNASILATEDDGKKFLAEMRKQVDIDEHLNEKDGENDGFTADDADAEADTGEELPTSTTEKAPETLKENPHDEQEARNR